MAIVTCALAQTTVKLLKIHAVAEPDFLYTKTGYMGLGNVVVRRKLIDAVWKYE